MTPYDMMKRLQALNVKELAGKQDHPAIQWAHMLCGLGGNQHDEVPWCSAAMNMAHALVGAPRTRSATARSWLTVGAYVPLEKAQVGDVVIFKRGDGVQPGPEVIAAPGHVAFFEGRHADGRVLSFGANQSNAITTTPIDADRVLGVRRVA